MFDTRNIQPLYPEVTEVRDTGFNTMPAGWYVVKDEKYIGPCKWHEAMTHAQSLGRPLDAHDALYVHLIYSTIKDWSFKYDNPEYIEVTAWIPRKVADGN